MEAIMILLKKGIEIFLEIDMSRLQLSNCRSFWLKPRLQEILTMKIRFHIQGIRPAGKISIKVLGYKKNWPAVRFELRTPAQN